MQVQTSGNSKTYNIEEHKHRFAVWAASRGASTRRAAFSVAEGKTILEAIGLNRNLDRLPSPGRMDVAHRRWRLKGQFSAVRGQFSRTVAHTLCG